MGATEALAQFVVNTKLRDIPIKAIETSKLVILDLLGVTLAASRQPGAKIITDYVREFGAAAKAGIIGSDLRSDASLAAWANGTLGFLLDFDDNIHGSRHTLPAALAICEGQNPNGTTLFE